MVINVIMPRFIMLTMSSLWLIQESKFHPPDFGVEETTSLSAVTRSVTSKQSFCSFFVRYKNSRATLPCVH